ncbi:MAG: hypothetical protein ACTHOL_05900 [Luteibacter jiangsuensis]
MTQGDDVHSRTFLLVALAFLASCTWVEKPRADTVPLLVDVLTRPAAYEGKTITVEAWISLADEDHNLWLGPGDHERWDTRRCISLTRYDQVSDHLSLNGKRVRATGIVRNDASFNGRIVRLGACRNLALELVKVAQM